MSINKLRTVAAATLAVAAASTVAAACQPVVPYGQTPAISMDGGSYGHTSFVTGGGWKAGSTVTILMQSTVNGTPHRVPATSPSGTVGSNGRFILAERLARKGSLKFIAYGTSWKGTPFSSAVSVYVK